MTARSLVLAAIAMVGCSSPARGAAPSWRRPVLVELYTSQGCSACPPADAFVRDLPARGLGRDKVIPLTFHVDYWDRLGWKDPFASKVFTGRQGWYAASGKLRSPDGAAAIDGLYTPQMIVNGTVHFSGQRRQVALREIAREAAHPPRFDLAIQATVQGAAATLKVRVAGLNAATRHQDWRVIVALAARATRTSVGRGENSGETLDEVEVVRALSPRIPVPAADGAVDLRLSKPDDLDWSAVDIVVFVQSEATRDIGAVRALSARQLTTK